MFVIRNVYVRAFSSTFFKYDEPKPDINCSWMNLKRTNFDSVLAGIYAVEENISALNGPGNRGVE